MTKQNKPANQGGQRSGTQGKRGPGPQAGRGSRAQAPRGGQQPARTHGQDTRKNQAPKGKKTYGNIPPAKPFVSQNRDMGYEEASRSNRQYNHFNLREQGGFASGPMNRAKRGPQRGGQAGRQQSFVSPAQQRFGPGSKRPFRNADRPAYQQQPHSRPVPAPENIHANYEDVVQISEDLPQVNLLTGRNPIREAIKTGRDMEKLMIAKGELSGSAREIVSLAKKAGILIQSVERSRLDQLAKNHQGMIAFASAYQYATVEEILKVAKERGEDPFIIVLDQITDPHNLGAVIRTAACAGAHGVIVPQHRAVGLTPAAVKASAGAVEHIKVARVTNLNQTIKTLQKQGVWFYAADTEGEDYRSVSFNGPCALVIGSEGEGISRLILNNCDKRIQIPMVGEMNSLNASVAAGILMYGVFGSRKPLTRT